MDCLLLGARTPAESLVRAVRDTAAAAVILVCHLPAGRQAAIDALRAAELNQTSIYYAGGAFASHQARQGVPGHHLGDNLTRAADTIAHALRTPIDVGSTRNLTLKLGPSVSRRASNRVDGGRDLTKKLIGPLAGPTMQTCPSVLMTPARRCRGLARSARRTLQTGPRSPRHRKTPLLIITVR